MAEELVRQYKSRLSLLEQLGERLEEETHETLAGLPHIDRVSFRVKSAQSFARKVVSHAETAPYEYPLIEVEDQVAGRIIVFFLRDVHLVLDKLRGTFTTIERSHRKPERDSEFAYESHHLICNIAPHLVPVGWNERADLPSTFELQVRTIFMHAYAEPQHDFVYKRPGDLPTDVRRELAWIAASAWGADKAYERVRVWNAQQSDEK